MSMTEQPSIQDRIRAAFYGLAICDALGAPLEFGPRIPEGSFHVDMEPNHNFGVGPGYFTDDTSMALCLAESLVECKGSNAVHQAFRYLDWLDHGHNSAVEGPPLDVGIQTTEALYIWRQNPAIDTLSVIAQNFDRVSNCGNGSLMRVLPCAIVTSNETTAIEFARGSSRMTHPHSRCVAACDLYVRLVHSALRGATKQDLIGKMRSFLNEEDVDVVLKSRLDAYNTLNDYRLKHRNKIKSSGYVVDTLEAALWAFFRFESFEQGAIEVVNLGDDADTVGAVYGGLAGAFYGKVEDHFPERWLSALESAKLVDEKVQMCTNMYLENAA